MNDKRMLLNTRRAAKRVGLSPRTLECHRVTGQGPELPKDRTLGALHAPGP